MKKIMEEDNMDCIVCGKNSLCYENRGGVIASFCHDHLAPITEKVRVICAYAV